MPKKSENDYPRSRSFGYSVSFWKNYIHYCYSKKGQRKRLLKNWKFWWVGIVAITVLKNQIKVN